MTWTKLGDEFADETIDLSDAAYRTHVDSLIWSNRKLADLIIPKKLLPRITAVDDPFAAAEELVATGWWQDCGQTYYAGCRFADWQLTRSAVEHRRDQTAERVRRHRLHTAGDHSLCKACSSSVTRYATRTPTRDETRDGTRSPGTERDGTGNPKPSQDTSNSTTTNDLDDDYAAHMAAWEGRPPPDRERKNQRT
jgi:hypothetical protein